MTKLDELTQKAWDAFENAGAMDQAAMSVAVLAVLAEVRAMVPNERKGTGEENGVSITHKYVDGWNNCRAEMLRRLDQTMEVPK